VARNVTTKDEFEKAALAFDTAKLDTKQRLLEAEQTLAAVRHRQAILETARKRLSDTRIVAPEITARATDGAVVAGPPLSYPVAERFISEGEIVRAAPPTKLFRLIVEDVLKLKAAVPERHASQVKPGQTVELAVESLPGRKVAGRVVRVNPTIDTANRTFEIEVQVPNAERLLKSGAFATASVLVGVDDEALTVPEEAIVRFAGVTKVFAVVADQAVAIPVTLGTRLDIVEPLDRRRGWVEVTGELPAGAPVVTSGQSQLAAGTPVRIRTPAREHDDAADLRAARHDGSAVDAGTAR
jgi:RND family efflux transporter MFP subunit